MWKKCQKIVRKYVDDKESHPRQLQVTAEGLEIQIQMSAWKPVCSEDFIVVFISSRQNPGWYFKRGHYRFLPQPFEIYYLPISTLFYALLDKQSVNTISKTDSTHKAVVHDPLVH
jgi:hypothetical protein